jgi:O-antigen/teichoic acid export membrane protein
MSLIKRNLFANFAGKIWAGLINLAFIPVYLKYMGAEAFGLVGFSATLQSLVIILDLGIPTAINREFALYTCRKEQTQNMRDLLRSIEVIYWFIALMIALIIYSFSGYLSANWLNSRELRLETVQWAIILIGISLAFEFLASLYGGGLLGLQHHATFNILKTVMWTIRGVGAVFMVMSTSAPLINYFMWQVMISAISTLIFAVFLWAALPKSSCKASFNISLVKSIMRFAFGMSAISIILLLFNQVDKIIVSRWSDLEMFGYYSLAWQVVGVLFLIYYPVYTTFFPIFTQAVAKNDFQVLKQKYHLACQLMAVILLPISLFIGLFSHELILAWTGNHEAMQHSAPVLSIVLVGATSSALRYLPFSLLQAFGKTGYGLSVYIPGLFLLISVMAYVTGKFGILGAASAWSFICVLQNGILITIVHRKYLPGVHVEWLINDLARPLIGSLTAIGLAKLIFIWPAARLEGLLLSMGILATAFVFSAGLSPSIFSVIKKNIFSLLSSKSGSKSA